MVPCYLQRMAAPDGVLASYLRMTGSELLRRLRPLGQQRGVEVRLDELKGRAAMPPFTTARAVPS
jgi:hypothetical protein